MLRRKTSLERLHAEDGRSSMCLCSARDDPSLERLLLRSRARPLDRRGRHLPQGGLRRRAFDDEPEQGRRLIFGTPLTITPSVLSPLLQRFSDTLRFEPVQHVAL